MSNIKNVNWNEWKDGTIEACLGGRILKIKSDGQGDVALGPFGHRVNFSDELSIEEKKKILILDAYKYALRELKEIEDALAGICPPLEENDL